MKTKEILIAWEFHSTRYNQYSIKESLGDKPGLLSLST